MSIGADMCEMTGKNKRYFELAKRTAQKSGFRTRHGAVLVKGGSVINVSTNSDDYCSFGMRFRNEPGKATIHAEIGVILGLDRSVTEGSTIYVARINKKGEYRMSKPCPMCQAALKHVGVKRVIYTTDNSVEKCKL